MGAPVRTTKPKYLNSLRRNLFAVLLVLMLMITMMPFVGSATDGFDIDGAETQDIEQANGSDLGDPSGDPSGDPNGDPNKDPNGDLNGNPSGDPNEDPGDELDEFGSIVKKEGSEEDPESSNMPIIPTTGSIAGFLWVDGNGMLATCWDGMYNGDEILLAGYKVSLYAADDLTTPVATTTTKLDGTYEFSDLEPGDYVLGLVSSFTNLREYLLPFSVTADNMFAIDSTWTVAYTEPISVEAGQAITGINAGMRLPMGIQNLAFADTIDLSETTAGNSSLGYAVSAGMNPYSVQYPGGVGSAVGTGSGSFRTLTFSANANGREFLIVQTGKRTSPVNGEPKYQTSIFNSIIIESGVNVTLVVESIDLIGNIDVRGNGNLTLLLATDTTTPAIGSFIHGSIMVSYNTSSALTASITIDDFNVSGSSGSTLKIMDVLSIYAGIGGYSPTGTTDTTWARGGNITINGGNIIVDLANQNSRSAAAIGGGLFSQAGNITINGGTVYASSNNTAAAIGCGQQGQGGSITINGGTVTAELLKSTFPGAGDPSAAAIGSGANTASGTPPPVHANNTIITITGGKVTALTSIGPGAAIGGGSGYHAGTINISGGDISARNTWQFAAGAGIGGGVRGGTGTINISGGTIYATSVTGAGIGGGANGPAPTISISAAATIRAFTWNADSKPAIEANGPNQGNGFYVNAMLSKSPGRTPMDVLVFTDGYNGGNPADRITMFTLPVHVPSTPFAPIPATYMRFAYTTGATATQNDNLYINLGYSEYLGQTEYRIIDRVFDNGKPIPSTNNLTSYNPYNSNAGNGVLPVKVRELAVAGTPSSDNIEKFSADLISEDHSLGVSTFTDGGFRYSTTTTVSGRPASPVNHSWALAAFTSSPITRNTMSRIAPDPELIPNTRYYLITYITVMADYWLTPVGPANFTFESTEVHDFVTKPHISNGSAAPSGTPGEAIISATFVGGTESLRVWIYWDTDPINPNDRTSWGAHNFVELTFDDGVTPGDFTHAGFSDFVIDGLTPGGDYNFMVVSENETGYAFYMIGYTDVVDFIFFKINEANAPMAGVSFSLYECTDSDPATHVHPPLVTGAVGECWGNPITVLSETNGRVLFPLLSAGKYMLVENNTHAGYQLPMGQWLIDIDNSLVITITAHSVDVGTIPPAFKTAPNGDLQLPNYPQMIVPLSGGVGLAVTTTMGIVLLGDALIFMLLNRRRQRLLEEA